MILASPLLILPWKCSTQSQYVYGMEVTSTEYKVQMLENGDLK